MRLFRRTQRRKKEEMIALSEVAYSSLQIGIGVGVISAGSGFLGLWLDDFFETKHTLTFVAILFGLVLSGAFVWWIVQPLFQNGEE